MFEAVKQNVFRRKAKYIMRLSRFVKRDVKLLKK